MRLPSNLLLSSLLLSTTLAADQIPLKEKAQGWFDKAKSYIPSGTPSIPDPIDAGASAIAEKKVEKINIRNHERKLKPKLEGEEEWIVYLTGGNKTCFGRCGRADAAWNEAIPLLSALPQPAGSPSLHLARLDCEKDAVLCTGWAASSPSIYHFTFPQRPSTPDTPAPATPLRVIELNTTTVTASDIVTLARSAPNSRIQEIPTYDGALHPVDGWLAKLGLQYYFGYAIWLMGSTPSWAIMIFISFMSRQFMGRRAGGQRRPDIYGAGAAGGAGPAIPQPAAVPAGAGRGTPGSAGKGGKKKR